MISAISCRDHSGELTGTSENKQCHLFLLLNSWLLPGMWPWKGRKKRNSEIVFMPLFEASLCEWLPSKELYAWILETDCQSPTILGGWYPATAIVCCDGDNGNAYLIVVP